MRSVFLNFDALVLAVVAMGASFVVYRKLRSGKRLVYMADFSQILVFCISLFYIVVELAQFDTSQLGEIGAFAIMANIYASLVNIGVRMWWLLVATAGKQNNLISP